MKQKRIEEIVKETDALMSDLEGNSPEVYMPNHPSLVKDLEDYWEAMKPQSLRGAQLMALPFPSFQIPYYLWKLPPHIHEYFNSALKYATSVLSRTDPEAALATGVFYGISQAIYGIKTRSGKHLMSGLVRILTNLKEHPDTKEFSKKILDSLKDYFSKSEK